MKKQALKYIFLTLTLIISIICWYSINQSISNDSASMWLAPIVWFSIFFIVIAADILLIDEGKILYAILSIAFLLSFIFTMEIWQLAFIAGSIICLWYFISKSRKEARYNAYFDVRKVFFLTKYWLVLAIALSIIGQVNFERKNMGVENSFPKIDLGEARLAWIPRILANFNSSFYALDDKGLTLDQFILENYRATLNDFGEITSVNPEDSSNALFNASKEMFLKEGRLKFSALAGRELLGNEKALSVFSMIVNNKVENFFVKKDDGQGPISPPVALSAGLFAIIFSVGSILNYFIFLALRILFWLLRKFRLVRLTRIPAEVEIID